MKILLLGNAGAGKSTLARKLSSGKPVPRLSLDEVAFAGTMERRPLAKSVADARSYIATQTNWIIEGCYGDIIAALVSECDELIFLNPGVQACVAHCQTRPWEPSKFSSREEQDANLENLIDWISTYETREDEYGLKCHRAIFDSFQGKKHEYRNPRDYS